MSADRPELVFAYGTLRQGASNHWRMEGATKQGPARVRGRLYTIDWYPGLILDPEGDEVRGEVYEVPSQMLAALDEFEGEEFERVRAMVRGDSGPDAEVWVYAYTGSVAGLAPRRPADWLRAGE